MTTKRHPAIGTSDMAAIEAALRQGARRRDLMKWLGAAGLSAATASLIIGDAGRAFAQSPERGGGIKVASQTSSTADTVDPAKQNNQTDYTRCFTFYNGVTRPDASLTPQLELAEAIDSDAGATVWALKLRRDVKFHNGTPLTADDVVFSLARHKDPATGSAVKALAADEGNCRQRLDTVVGALMSISHDLASARAVCDEVMILYAGHVMERGPGRAVMQAPHHPYADLLAASMPELRPGWLDSIDAVHLADAGGETARPCRSDCCAFMARCPVRVGPCASEAPPIRRFAKGSSVRCHRIEQELLARQSSSAVVVPLQRA